VKARQIIEAEDPKAFMQRHVPRQMRWFRFAVAEGAIGFSVMALEENQAVQRAQQFIANVGPSFRLLSSQYIDLIAHMPQEEIITAANIISDDDANNVFQDSEDAVRQWEEEFKLLIA